jgi:hypothetical protein
MTSSVGECDGEPLQRLGRDRSASESCADGWCTDPGRARGPQPTNPVGPTRFAIVLGGL